MAVCVAAFFVSSEALQTDIMESRNLVTANEMVEYGNWLVPTMNGELRLEKPPFPTWVAAVIQILVPDSIGAQRAAAGTMGALWALFLFLTVEAVTWREDTAGLSTIIFLTCYSVVLMGRTATWDIYCHAFMQGAVWLLFRIFYTDPCERRRRHIWMFLVAGLLMGLSFLSKGPVSFFALLLPFMIACAFYGRPDTRFSGPGVTVMLVTLLVVSMWWYVYIYVFHTDLATAVLHKESGAWVSHNVRPWWYYWRYFLETGVWSLLTLAALLAPLFVRALRGQRDFVFAVVWMLGAVVLLSLMPEKKTRYLLPVMAPSAMSVGIFLMYVYDEWNEFRAGRIIYRVNGWLVTVITGCLAVGVLYLWLGMGAVNAWVAIVSFLLLAADAVWMGICTRQGFVVHFVDAVAVLFIVAECLLMTQVTSFFNNPASRPISRIRTDWRVEGLRLFRITDNGVRMELVLGAGHRIRPIPTAKADTVLMLMPCAVLTKQPVSHILSARTLEKIDTVYIGTFDDNRHARTNSHYNPELVNRVTIIRPKIRFWPDIIEWPEDRIMPR